MLDTLGNVVNQTTYGIQQLADKAVESIFGPRDATADNRIARHASAVEINGVMVPWYVVEAIHREVGVPPRWLNIHELSAAVRATAIDRTLIEDHQGTDFFDKLHLSEEERAEQMGSLYGNRFTHKHTLLPGGFAEQIANEDPYKPLNRPELSFG